MALKVEVSVGEFLDKITILEIKAERISHPAKLANVNKELELLRATWAASALGASDVTSQVGHLKAVNEDLWEIEDNVRLLEAEQSFGERFIELARSVYKKNDERAAIKREINLMLGSGLVEEKSYTRYDHSAD